jgi:hypothetical protein
LEQYPDDLAISPRTSFDDEPTTALPNFAAAEFTESRHDPIEIGYWPQLARNKRDPPSQCRLKIALVRWLHRACERPNAAKMIREPSRRHRDKQL